MAKYEYATIDPDKVEAAKALLQGQAARKGADIVGFHVFRSSTYPKLQQHDATRGQEFVIILGFTTQSELNAAAAARAQ